MANPTTKKLRIQLLTFCLLLFPIGTLHADDYDDLWLWLDHVKDELINPPSWNQNKFRAKGYSEAVNRHHQ